MSAHALIFDLGGVFYRIEKQRTMLALASLIPESERNAFPADFDSFCDEPGVNAFETGQMGPRTFRNHFRENWNANCTDEAFDAAWNALLLGPDEELIQACQPLLANHRAFVLSTNNPIHLEVVRRACGEFLARFEHCYFSHETGLRKPEAAAFEQVLRERGLNAAETVFVDDGPQHVAAAERLGIRSHLFTSGSGLLQFLQSLT